MIQSDAHHLYLRVIDELKRSITDGKYKEMEKLPSEFELAQLLEVPRSILKKALSVLEEENIIVKRHGVGLFVNPQPIFSVGIENLDSVTEMIKKSGRTPGSHFLSTEMTGPAEEDIELFRPKELTELANIERIRTADGIPVVFCIERVPKELLPLETIYYEDSLHELLENYADKRIDYAITHIEPVGYQGRIYDLLECSPEQPLLLLKQMHYTVEDEPVLYALNYFRPDIFRFHVWRRRIEKD